MSRSWGHHLADTGYSNINEIERQKWPSSQRMTPAVMVLHLRPIEEIIACQRLRTTRTSRKSTAQK
jgi:hypothetical protein